MKKYFILLLTIFFFGIGNVSAATNECTLEDESTWKYETTLSGSSAQTAIANGDYEHSKCCVESSGNTICDFYSAIEISNEEASGSTSGTTNNGSTISGQTTGATTYCGGLGSTFMFIGHIVRIAKIFIPIVIIGFGMMDFFKAVTGSKDDEIKRSGKSLAMRCVAGVCIFFLPSVISLVFSWVDGWSANYENEMNSCFNCIWDVGSCT